MERLNRFFSIAVDYAWGPPLIFLLIGGGLFFLVYSRFLPFFLLGHSIDILRGKYDRPDDPGDISHFQALSTALAATIGLGNIGGVAIAITQGGPGAVFWMWVAAVVGMATKFFTCTLAVMYRGRDSLGQVQGGPMYYIEVGLGPKYRFLAIFFSICGMIGCLAMFQANQLAEILTASYEVSAPLTGIATVLLVAIVILGGLKRIANVASRMVPAMCLLYLMTALYIVGVHSDRVLTIFYQIFHDAFTGTAAAGGAAGIGFLTVVQTGIKRAVFSNEAGIGTAPMAHGAAKTTEPVREGLVAMWGPLADTIIVCSLTAFIILAAADWRAAEGIQGVALTLQAFENSLGSAGKFLLVIIVASFGLSTMFGYSYYGKKCFSYLFGAHRSKVYDYFYLIMLYVGAVWTAGMVVNMLDTAFALMAFPNMIAALLLAPRVMGAARDYLSRHGSNGSSG
ncbi:MAG TPA: sodium:alanine symporter family protein [Acidobacteriota bacterium]|nr:sodium:alanine symporter family protein [Acidobacteriota bacterium]